MAPFFVALTFAVSLQALPEPAPRDIGKGAAPSGAISGRITEQDTGHPLPRIVVKLTTVDRAHAVEAFTDSDGVYRFEGLDSADYMLRRRYSTGGPRTVAPRTRAVGTARGRGAADHAER